MAQTNSCHAIDIDCTGCGAHVGARCAAGPYCRVRVMDARKRTFTANALARAEASK